MIVFRRFLAVALSLALFLFLVMALVALQVRGTVLNPEFYADLLDDGDFYEFLLTDAAASALEERPVINGGSGVNGEAGFSIEEVGLDTDDVAAALYAAVPSTWLQDSAEQVIYNVGGYTVGDADEFSVTIDTEARAQAFVDELRPLFQDPEVYGYVLEQFIRPVVANMYSGGFVPGASLNDEEISDAARRLIPEDWMLAEIDDAYLESAPYLLGKSDSFRVRVKVEERSFFFIEEYKDILRDNGSYDLFYEQMVERSIADSLGGPILLPVGIVVTEEDVADTMRSVAPDDWVDVQGDRIMDDATMYLVGREESFESHVPLERIKKEVDGAIEELASEKISEALAGLPTCTTEQAIQIIESGTIDELPECVPPLMPVQQIADFLGREVATQVGPYVVEAIPDETIVTEVEFREVIGSTSGPDGLEQFEASRVMLRDGWVYTESDLKVALRNNFQDGPEDGDPAATLDEFRSYLSDGWNLSDEDLRGSATADASGGVLSSLDRYRNGVKWFRTLAPLLLLPMLATLAGVALLGGTNWRGRLAWGAGALAATSVLMFLPLSPLFGLLFDGRLANLEASITGSIGSDGAFGTTIGLVATKMAEIATQGAKDVASGLASMSLVTLAIGLIGVLIALSWNRLASLVHRS